MVITDFLKQTALLVLFSNSVLLGIFMKQDEKELLQNLQKRTNEDPNIPQVRQLVMDLGMNQKRAAYILEKWAKKDWYEYGVNTMSGWLTDEGRGL